MVEKSESSMTHCSSPRRSCCCSPVRRRRTEGPTCTVPSVHNVLIPRHSWGLKWKNRNGQVLQSKNSNLETQNMFFQIRVEVDAYHCMSTLSLCSENNIILSIYQPVVTSRCQSSIYQHVAL